jgi:hypothetical protein
MIGAFQAVSMWARRCVAYPLLLLGIGIAGIAAGLVNLSAWLVDVDLDEIEVE